MAEVVLFHHVQGLTPGVVAFADELRRAGHTVHTPDLFDGHTFDSIEEGLAHEEGLADNGGIGVDERADRAVAELPEHLVYAGMSLGVMPAQRLAQNRPDARGALLLHSCVPTSAFGSGWPQGVPVQIHAMDHDPFFTEEGGDIDAARALVKEAEQAELFLYPGDDHLFTDSSLAAYDATATSLVQQRVATFLSTI